MTTYPTNIRVLDKDITNSVMEEADITAQELYTFYIAPNTLDTNSKLRIKAVLSRVSGTPLAESDVTCIPCSEGGRVVSQQLVQDRILTPTSDTSGFGSFSYVGEYQGQHEIYEGIYSFKYGSTATFDLDPNWVLYRIRKNNFKKVAKVLTTTFSDLGIADVQPIHGIADEPTYAMSAIVSISSNAPDGFYLYYVNGKTQVSCPSFGQFYDSFYAVFDRNIFLVERNTATIRKFNEVGEALLNSTAIYGGGYGIPIAMHALDDFLYVLTFSNNIIKCNASTLAIITVWPLSPVTTAIALFASSHSNIYFSFGSPNVLGIAALNTGTGVITYIDSGITLTEGIGFGIRSVLYFKALEGKPGYFYTTSSAVFGTGGYSRIMRIGPIDCP